MRLLTRGKKPAGRAATAKQGAAPRRKANRIDPGMLRRGIKLGAAGVCGVALIAGAVAAHRLDVPGQIAGWAERTTLDMTARMGFAVRDVYVVGRAEADRDDLIAAVGLSVGDPILAEAPEDIRERVEALGWVKSAEVRRVFPGTLIVTVEERQAVAIWQNGDAFVLIDPDGIEIGARDVHRHRHLKVVVGPDAPRHAMSLLSLLAEEPELEDRVVAAVRVGQRRWNLRLDGGVDVRLPERDVEVAWRMLAEYQRDHEILSRAIDAIDLRYPDRISVQVTEPGLQEIRGREVEGEET
jgi:cell division protein FtsQ